MDTNASIASDATKNNAYASLLSNSDNECIKDIVNVLKKHNCLDRFGLTLLHSHFDLEENEVLAETNNPICRTLLVEPIEKNDLENFNYYETAWRFDDGQPTPTCVCLKEL